MHLNNFFNYWMMQYGMNEKLSIYLSNILTVLSIVIIAIAAGLIAKKLLLKILSVYVSKSKNKWDDILLERKVLDPIAYIAPVLVIQAFAPIFPAYQEWIQRIAMSGIIFIVIITANRLMDAVEDIYRGFEISKIRPIKGYVQVVQMVATIVGVIIIIGILINRSPLLLLSGIGAATAVILLIFKDSLLGLVASIQLAGNNMVNLGDWIEMPAYGANGTVLDITLHTVKVKNFNNTITTIPTYALISEPFNNWRAMEESGGRRIKRSVYIDMTSIKFCTEEMLERFGQIRHINKYIQDKRLEIDEYNRINNIDTSIIVNGRHLTNIGTFRAYIEQYLKNHPKVHKSMTLLVRQLQPTENGLPIEVYFFAKNTDWISYEAIQSDVFDHILAIIPEFDLRISQSPTGFDLRSIKVSSREKERPKLKRSLS